MNENYSINIYVQTMLGLTNYTIMLSKIYWTLLTLFFNNLFLMGKVYSCSNTGKTDLYLKLRCRILFLLKIYEISKKYFI